MCKSNADCENGATCNIDGECVCPDGFVGLDCSLDRGNFFSRKSAPNLYGFSFYKKRDFDYFYCCCAPFLKWF